MPVYSPINGAELEATSIANIYRDTVYGTEYIVNNGIVTKISSPSSGGNLIRNSDGTYTDPYIAQVFSFDDTRNAFIPHYIPDDTAEPAHIEGNFLVGNDSGRRFEIDANGRILTPAEISFQARHGEDMATIARMEADGTIDEYLERASQRSREIQQSLEQKRQEGTLDAYFDSLVNGNSLDEEQQTLTSFDEVMEHIGELTEEELDELMIHFNDGHAQIRDRRLETYSDPVVASKINARYRVLTGEEHPIFLERITSIIESYMSSKDRLLKIGGYFNEQYFMDLTNIQKYVSSKYTYKNDISRVEQLRQMHQKQGIVFSNEYYEMEELKDKAEKGEITAADLKNLCDITFGADTPESQLVFDSMIKSGRVAPSEEIVEPVETTKLK